MHTQSCSRCEYNQCCSYPHIDGCGYFQGSQIHIREFLENTCQYTREDVELMSRQTAAENAWILLEAARARIAARNKNNTTNNFSETIQSKNELLAKKYTESDELYLAMTIIIAVIMFIILTYCLNTIITPVKEISSLSWERIINVGESENVTESGYKIPDGAKPLYKEELSNGKILYTYVVEKTNFAYASTSSGQNKSAYWNDIQLEGNQKELSREEHYYVLVENDVKYKVPYDTWLGLEVGQKIKINFNFKIVQ